MILLTLHTATKQFENKSYRGIIAFLIIAAIADITTTVIGLETGLGYERSPVAQLGTHALYAMMPVAKVSLIMFVIAGTKYITPEYQHYPAAALAVIWSATVLNNIHVILF